MTAPATQRRLLPATSLALFVWLGGCGPSSSWVYTFVEAENTARRAEKPMFVFYRDPFDPLCGKMLDVVESPAVMRLTSNMIRCSLVTEYDPNRRFAAQYGIMGAPAIIIVHPDGTYHARRGPGDVAAISAFVTQSKPPGHTAKVDIQIPRPPDFLIRAEGNYEKAVEQARRHNRTMMVVYKWWLDPASTELIRNMSRPQVATRCTEMVVCLLDWDYVPNREFVSKLGVTQFPAIILVHPDGTTSTHQGSGTTEEIVRFLAKSRARDTAGT